VIGLGCPAIPNGPPKGPKAPHRCQRCDPYSVLRNLGHVCSPQGACEETLQSSMPRDSLPPTVTVTEAVVVIWVVERSDKCKASRIQLRWALDSIGRWLSIFGIPRRWNGEHADRGKVAHGTPMWVIWGPYVQGSGDLGSLHRLPQNLAARWGEGRRTLWGGPGTLPGGKMISWELQSRWAGDPQQEGTVTGDPPLPR